MTRIALLFVLALSGVVAAFATISPAPEANAVHRETVTEPIAIPPSALQPAPSSYVWESRYRRGETLATLLVNIYAAYGLATMRQPIYMLVAVISILMATHLLIFLFVPLGMSLAYIGPSRAFYAGLLALAMTTRGFGQTTGAPAATPPTYTKGQLQTEQRVMAAFIGG